MKPLDPTPRDDFTKDDVPGWTPKAVEELQRKPHDVRLAERLALRKKKPCKSETHR